MILFIGIAGYWVVATEGGARWLLARVAPMLPDELEVADLAKGMSLEENIAGFEPFE